MRLLLRERSRQVDQKHVVGVTPRPVAENLLSPQRAAEPRHAAEAGGDAVTASKDALKLSMHAFDPLKRQLRRRAHHVAPTVRMLGAHGLRAHTAYVH